MYQACKTLWDNIVGQKMYVTGGVGSTVHGEAYSADYELPNDLVYAESAPPPSSFSLPGGCWEREPKPVRQTFLEKELYNGLISGMQLDGKRFFYVNPLEVVPGVSGKLPKSQACAAGTSPVVRLRLLPAQCGPHRHLPGGHPWGRTRIPCIPTCLWEEGYFVRTGQSSPASPPTPWDWDSHSSWKRRNLLCLCHPHPRLVQKMGAEGKRPRGRISDEGGCAFPPPGLGMPGTRWSCPSVWSPGVFTPIPRSTRMPGCVALARGPIVYCMEEADDEGGRGGPWLPRGFRRVCLCGGKDKHPIGDVPVLEAQEIRLRSDDALYSGKPPVEEEVSLTAVPYYTWGRNLGTGSIAFGSTNNDALRKCGVILIQVKAGVSWPFAICPGQSVGKRLFVLRKVFSMDTPLPASCTAADFNPNQWPREIWDTDMKLSSRRASTPPP